MFAYINKYVYPDIKTKMAGCHGNSGLYFQIFWLSWVYEVTQKF